MSDELKNKFRDYEADVSDEHLEARWQAIRPLLPAEENRKGFVLPTPARRRTLVAFLVLVTLAISLFLVRDANSSATLVSQTEIPAPVPSANTEGAGSGQSTSSPDPSSPGASPAAASVPAFNGKADHTLRKKMVNQPVPGKSLSPALSNTTTATPAGTNEMTLQKTNDVLIQDITPVLSMDSGLLAADHLRGVPWRPDTSVREVRLSDPREIKYLRGTLRGRSMVEAFGGATRYQHMVKRDRLNGLGFVAGVSVHTRLRGKVFLPFQVTVTGPQKVSESVSTELVPVPPPATTGLTTTAAGNQQYERLVHNDHVTTSMGLQAAIGLGYRLLATRQLTVSALGMAEASTFERKSTRITTREDGTSTKQQPIPTSTFAYAIAPQKSAAPPSRQFTYALVPGLHLSYKLAPRWALTGRCTWHVSPRINESVAPEFYMGSRKHLDLCAGLSFRW